MNIIQHDLFGNHTKIKPSEKKCFICGKPINAGQHSRCKNKRRADNYRLKNNY